MAAWIDIRLAALVDVDGVTWNSGIHQSHNSPTTPSSIYIYFIIIFS